MTSPLRILYILSTLERSGPVQMLAQLTSHLDREKFLPSILTLSEEPARSMRGCFVDGDIPVASLAMSRASWYLAGRASISKAIRSMDPHLVHSHGFRADTALAQLDIKAAHCCTVHNIPAEDYPRMYGVVQGGMMARAHMKAYRRIATPVAVSDSIGRTIGEALGRQIHVIPNGINTDDFAPASTTERALLRAALDIPTDAFVYVTAAPFIPRKDPVTIIDAFLRLNDPRAFLVMLGDGPLHEQCARLARNTTVRLPGFRADVRDWLRAADVYVSASLAEGLPMAVLEAFACGLPAVLSDIGPHREAAGSSRAARLYRVSDSLSCAASMREAMTDAEQRRLEARERVVGVFSAARMSARYQELYGTLTASPAIGR